MALFGWKFHWTKYSATLQSLLAAFKCYELLAGIGVKAYNMNGHFILTLEFFIDTKSFLSHDGPGVDPASNRNEYQEHFLGVKAVGA